VGGLSFANASRQDLGAGPRRCRSPRFFCAAAMIAASPDRAKASGYLLLGLARAAPAGYSDFSWGASSPSIGQRPEPALGDSRARRNVLSASRASAGSTPAGGLAEL